jgi:tetratricopeptide (TPR) repeat protein
VLLEKNKDKDDKLIKGVRLHLADAYRMMTRVFAAAKKWNKVLENANKLLGIDDREITGLLHKAIALARLGEKKESEKVVNKLLEQYPDRAITNVNVAYFRVVNKQYKAALKSYKKIRLCYLDFEPLEVIEWLEDELDRYPKEYGYLFGAGYLNFHYRDEKRGLDQLKEFVQKANIEPYRKMWGEADRIVNNSKITPSPTPHTSPS